MSAEAKRYFNHLEILRSSSAKERKNFLKIADDNLISLICEVCLNYCHGTFDCDENSCRRLLKHKRDILALASLKSRKSNLKKERKILLQRGSGFLPILLAPVLSSLASFVIEKAFQ